MSVAPDAAIGQFGPLVLSTDVDARLLGAMQEWMPTYLGEMRDRAVVENAATPRSYTNTIESAEVSRQPTAVDQRDHDGGCQRHRRREHVVTSEWRTIASAVLRGRRPAEARRRLASIYGGLVLMIALQQGRDDVVVNSIRADTCAIESIPDPILSGRYLCLYQNTLLIHTDVAVRGDTGPTVPDMPAYVPAATVTEVDIEVAGETVIARPGGSP